jgi:hypothetical protein
MMMPPKDGFETLQETPLDIMEIVIYYFDI